MSSDVPVVTVQCVMACLITDDPETPLWSYAQRLISTDIAGEKRISCLKVPLSSSTSHYL